MAAAGVDGLSAVIASYASRLDQQVEDTAVDVQQLTDDLAQIFPQLEALSKDGVRMAVYVRNLFIKVLKLVKRCHSSATQIAAICQLLKTDFARFTEAWNPIHKLHNLIAALESCMSLNNCFAALAKQFEVVRRSFGKAVDAGRTFTGKVQTACQQEKEHLLQDMQAIGADIESGCAHCLFSLRSLCSCCRVARAAENGSEVQEMVQRVESCLGEFGFISESNDVEQMSSQVNDINEKINTMTATFRAELDKLERPPSGFLEHVASPFVKIYHSAELSVTVVRDISKAPQIWREAKAAADAAKDLFKRAEERWEAFWESLVNVTRSFCEYVSVPWSAAFADRAISDVQFHPKLGFMTVCEHKIVDLWHAGCRAGCQTLLRCVSNGCAATCQRRKQCCRKFIWVDAAREMHAVVEKIEHKIEHATGLDVPLLGSGDGRAAAS